MKLDEQVCSYSQAKKLAQLGFTSTTQFYWITSESFGKTDPVLVSVQDQQTSAEGSFYAAPTVAELGILLPTEISHEDELYYLQGTIGNRQGEFYYIWFQSSLDNAEWELFPSIEKDTEAEARAEALIWLIENDFVSVEKLTC